LASLKRTVEEALSLEALIESQQYIGIKNCRCQTVPSPWCSQASAFADGGMTVHVVWLRWQNLDGIMNFGDALKSLIHIAWHRQCHADMACTRMIRTACTEFALALAVSVTHAAKV